MRLSNFWLRLLIFLFSLNSYSSGLRAGEILLRDSVPYISPFLEDNERCFKCHGQGKYEYINESFGTNVKALMCDEMIVKRDEFYDSNHKSFRCTDCHSVEYGSFPHPGALRMELNYNCLDCHGDDDTSSSFDFEEIDAEYKQSIHSRYEGFTCWKCHNPHSYKINIKNLKETILYDNRICLNCHSDFSHFQLLSDKDEINILEKHDWLPNQASHFGSVSCFECHTKINDTINLSHLIMPKDNAVRRCNECHSKNSLMMATLYRFKSREQRRSGFLNGIILNESFVIGANRNVYLNAVSIIIIAVVVLLISIHILFRIIRK